jgi:predicted TIM-barrel fold metal-dependent hydrolase
VKRFTKAPIEFPEGMRYLDVHQHLWPAALVDALRERTRPPLLRGWTLHLDGEPPYEVDPHDHDPGRRAALEDAQAAVLVSLSAPLGIEALEPDDAQPLLDAWHEGARALSAPFSAWASVSAVDPDVDGLGALLSTGFVGLQVPAGQVASPPALERNAPLLRRCEELGRPVLVHPGPAAGSATDAPAWWPALVDYPAQLAAAWWAWHEAGRKMLPELRICFAAGAGLAPVQHERYSARSGARFVVDPNAFVDTSSYGRQGVDALSRALGIDVLVFGTDRPYADRCDLQLGAAAERAVCVTNPTRLLEGGSA